MCPEFRLLLSRLRASCCLLVVCGVAPGRESHVECGNASCRFPCGGVEPPPTPRQLALPRWKAVTVVTALHMCRDAWMSNGCAGGRKTGGRQGGKPATRAKTLHQLEDVPRVSSSSIASSRELLLAGCLRGRAWTRVACGVRQRELPLSLRWRRAAAHPAAARAAAMESGNCRYRTPHVPRRLDEQRVCGRTENGWEAGRKTSNAREDPTPARGCAPSFVFFYRVFARVAACWLSAGSRLDASRMWSAATRVAAFLAVASSRRPPRGSSRCRDGKR